jgi:hypothetical protein
MVLAFFDSDSDCIPFKQLHMWQLFGCIWNEHTLVMCFAPLALSVMFFGSLPAYGADG